jgi:hypothetical protein
MTGTFLFRGMELAPFTVPPDLEKILAAEPQIQQVSDDSRHYEA